MKKIAAIFFILLAMNLLTFGLFGCNKPKAGRPVRIGYFHGRRTQVLFRAYINKYFEDENVNVEFYSRYFNKDGFYKVPKSQSEMEEKRSAGGSEDLHFGMARGTEIVEAIDEGLLEGGVRRGESSFIYKISTGSSIVAVAMLGYDQYFVNFQAVS